MFVTYSWLLEHLDDQNTVIIDTRPKISYSYGHIPNSISLTVEQIIEISSTGAHFAPNPEKASLQLGELGIDNEQIVVVCGDLMDPSVFRVAWTLQYLGQKNTKILNLSIGSWHGMGLNMTRVQKNSPITKFIPNVQNSIRIESEELFQLIDDLIILDARTPQEYFAGHIPRSILFPFTDGIGQDGMLLETKESLENLFVQKQIPRNKPLVCYCMHGHRASSLYFQAKIAGFENVRLYDGSYVDWHSKKLPLE